MLFRESSARLWICAPARCGSFDSRLSPPASCFWRLHFILKGFERIIPKLVEPAAQLAEAVWIDVINAACAIGSIGHEPRDLQRLEVLRNGRPTNRQFRRKIAHRRRPVPQSLEKRAASGVSECSQCGSVSHYLR